ncbi:MAG: aminomethyl-transferring glycine dehydrogenase subunit GcvPA [Hydrogenibacillus schlegelii]|uniref:Probable glycine dehydrogenase (decarboxylating) subunit 1 n=1 Tax=Hydrogenibacillus schlegelii TaxID=1484 RepID=A0A947CYH0_HYDSH|nr:aminomethyl-transferring glycine dehydrogenase subunit GcvPA [Hydrogenibacillus schlegelii]
MGHRYLPLTDADRQAMLEAIGVPDVEALFADIPDPVRLKRPLDLEPALTEPELVRELGRLAAKNRTTDALVSFLGAGAYEHTIPAVVDHVLRRSEFYTAYTPYQPELSQGNLQAIFEFQTMVASLTGMEVANASLYDGPTALAEAVLLSLRETRRKRVVLSEALHPHARSVVETVVRDLEGVTVDVAPAPGGATDAGALRALAADAAAVVVQTPNFFGVVEPLGAHRQAVAASGAMWIVSANPLALGLLRPPGDFGADLVVGDMQPLGIPLSFGGPYAGYLAARMKDVRKLPGRIVGETVDAAGRRGYVLTLQTREQHIRREKATSNITTNQALMALAAAVAMSAFGPRGLRALAEQNVHKTQYALQAIEARTPFRRAYPAPVFNEFVLELGRPADEAVAALLEQGFLAGYPLGSLGEDYRTKLLVAVTEVRTKAEIDAFVEALGRWGR